MEFLAHRKDRLVPSCHHRIPVLNGRHRAYGIGPSKIFFCCLGNPPITDLPFFDQLSHGLCHCLRLHLWIDPVLIIQIYVICSQFLQAALHTFSYSFRAAVQLQGTVRVVADAHLCGDHYFIPDPFDCFSYQFLIIRNSSIRIHTGIGFCCIKKIIPHIRRFPEGSDCKVFFCGIPRGMTESHTSKTHGIDIQVTVSKFSFFHFKTSFVSVLPL